MTKLEQMLKYVSEHNDFYKKRIKEYGITNPLDITQWPILTRKELQENRYNMFSDGYKSKYFNQQLRRQSSSGSTGVPVNVYWDYKDWYASNMCLWRKRNLLYGVTPSARCAMFTLSSISIHTEDKPVYYSINGNILNVNTSALKDDVGYTSILKIIEDFAPNWLYIQPFVLKRIMRAYKETRRIVPKSLQYIECVGELLEDYLKNEASLFFGVPIINMYGSEEMNGIGYAPFDSEMYALSDNVYVETSINNHADGEEQGEAIITCLNNKAMPLIRYNQGDIISIRRVLSPSYGECTLIDKIYGRSFEMIKLVDGNIINPLSLLELATKVMNEYGSAITGYRYVFYKQINELHCIISLDNDKQHWFSSIQESLENEFALKMLPKILAFSVKLSSTDTVFENEKRKVIQIIG